MLTDLHLQKYLDGELSDEEMKDLEALLEKSPELKTRLEALEGKSEVMGKATWQRSRAQRHARRGSRTRYTIMLPTLLILIVILMVAQHWFSKPGENSTFTMTGGNGSSIEPLYNNPKNGWRYLDASFKPADSLTFAVRDGGTWHVAVFAVYGKGAGAEAAALLADAPDRVYTQKSSKPVFTLGEKSSGTPSQIIVFYDDTPLPELAADRVLDLAASQGVERGGVDFLYQIYSASR